MDEQPVIVWLRRDLRVADNDALRAAADSGAPVIPVYVLDDERPRPLGGAHRWWLDGSLKALGAAFKKVGAPLVLRRGESVAALLALARETGATRILANRGYAPGERDAETDLAEAAHDAGVAFETFRGDLLTEPGEVRTGAGGGYKVFTPYLRALRAKVGDVDVAPGVRRLQGPSKAPRSDALGDWRLHPSGPDWSKGFDWTPGEAAAHRQLTAFVQEGLRDYPRARELPDRDGSSRLSPHLHWGELTSRQVWAAASAAGEAHHWEEAASKFLAEIVWRDFSHQVLFEHRKLATETFNPRLKALEWRGDPKGLEAWKRGRTGYPIVDAGMRQLWATGWMHNRVRMIVASFLSKDLLIDWREGERWFWDTLVDGDEANNAMNWQWVSGTGPDAQPFFRIFNPVGQSRKFDAKGEYIRAWAPELAKLDAKAIHAPWEADEEVLKAAGVKLGDTYPHPILVHAEARDRALEAYRALRE
ncbi:MAG: deoxyribodipyrimidine photo-lyase [Caulobacteraceae bacterium]|nr:deoxyribodipyrimidine photo-lyase [Caulobacter sp.]